MESFTEMRDFAGVGAVCGVLPRQWRDGLSGAYKSTAGWWLTKCSDLLFMDYRDIVYDKGTLYVRDGVQPSLYGVEVLADSLSDHITLCWTF